MSYFIKIKNLKTWLDKAQIALVSKNKIRKDLWIDFGEIILFEEEDDAVVISITEFTSIQSFLQNEGRSDNISNDSMLSWINMLHDLRRKLKKEFSKSVPASVSTTPVSSKKIDFKEDEAQDLTIQTE